MGDIEIEMSTEQFYPELRPSRGAIAGTGRVVGAAGKITCTMSEWNYTVLASLFSLGASSTANSSRIGSGAIGAITELSNVQIVGLTRNDGKAVRVTMARARVTSPVATTFSSNENAAIELVFEALFVATAVRTFPMWIEIAL